MAKSSIPFYVYLVGDSTGEIFRGNFAAKPRLSHRDELMKDKLRREYLGVSPDHASQDAVARAVAFADLRVRLVDYPSWWIDSGYGLDLFDENIISYLFEECTRIENEASAEFTKNAANANETLKALGSDEDGE